ncbi:MAG: pilus assembly protein N-terminal domain-containing protein [Selenomonadaceae bacterium]|nr:pilus assembly protein N-terminal domain-containing protein [Selenomonadaceae bacterium]
MSYSFLKKFFLTAAAVSFVSPSVYAMPETLSINIKTSRYMDMQKLITRIAVGNPGVATVIQLPGSASEFLIVTKENPGSTALFVWTIDGVRHEYLIVVSPEDPGQAMLIEQAINLPDVHVKMIGDRLLLTGTVRNQYEKNYALQTARLFIDGNSESSILVGSGFDMTLNTAAANNVGRSGNLEMTKSESKGKIIDMLQILYPTQIRLEAQIIEINSENTKDLGFQYGESGSNGKFYFGEYYSPTNTSTTNFEKPLIDRISQHFGPINATLSLLVSNGKARILSRPSVTTLSGEQATIQIGGKVPYTTTSSNGSTNTQFENYGIILQFRPVVDAQNRINSMVHAEVSNIGEYMSNGLPIITTRSADSVINLNSGAPIVIGGLMDSSESKRISKIPFLGDIPILGEFFKHTSKSRDKRELIIVVTPYLVGEDENSQTEISQPMRQWYEGEQQYRDAMKNYDFKKPEPEEEYEEEEPPRILPPSKINQDNKQSTTDKKNKSPNDDEIVEFPLDKSETDEPFHGK